LGGTCAKLEALGIEALGITEDSAEPVRSYYRIRPSKLRLATDPKRDVHRLYGLPMPFYAGAYTQLHFHRTTQSARRPLSASCWCPACSPNGERTRTRRAAANLVAAPTRVTV